MIMIGLVEMKDEYGGWIGNDSYWCVSDAPYQLLLWLHIIHLSMILRKVFLFLKR